jgi:hypothetical protein
MYDLLLFFTRIYIGLATLATKAMAATRCQRASLGDGEEDGAGDGHDDQPRDRPLIPVHNCGSSCPNCPHRSSGVNAVILVSVPISAPL